MVVGRTGLAHAALGDAGTSSAADPRISPARSDDLGQWLPLHHGLFPGSYLSDDEIAAAISDGPRLVLTARLDGRPAGYLVAKDDATMDELYVDYLGVDPAARGRGLGRALLRHAMRWGEDRGRRRAALTVRQDRAEALSLYLQCGFQQARAGVHWRKDRAKVEMTAREVVVTVDLGAGSATGWVWTNDLTAQYVHENSAYSS